jgi:hypothetical protein
MTFSKNQKYRMLLLQLPLVDPSFRTADANVPLAAGYLSAYTAQKLERDVEIEIAPQELSSCGGDRAILAYVEKGGFDGIGFTVYMWNLERSLLLAAELKKQRPITIMMGGPEITPGRKLLSRPEADVFASGEGEIGFTELLVKLMNNETLPKVCAMSPAATLAEIPNPYLSGILPMKPGAILHLETMRGCSRACTYCYYAKSTSVPRYFPPELLDQFFFLAQKAGAREIYLMDPSFECRPRFDGFLKKIALCNSTRIPLHTELSLESVTAERAWLLKEAGFVSVEAGLQSTNPRSLRAVRRHFDRARFLRGTEALQERGIAVRTGIILGLPEDTLEEFGKTLDFVSACGLGDGLEIYPLSLLPGSRLRQEAGDRGLAAMNVPPYWVLQTPTMPGEDFFRAAALVREKTGRDLFESVYPHFENAQDGFISFINLKSAADVEKITAAPERIANSLTALIDDALFRDTALLARFAGGLGAANPHTLLQLVIGTQRLINDDEAHGVSDLFFRPDDYLERCHAFDPDPQGRFSVRLFALTANPNLIRDFLQRDSFIDPVLAYTPGLLEKERVFLFSDQPLLVIDETIGTDEISELKRIYADVPERLLFWK